MDKGLPNQLSVIAFERTSWAARPLFIFVGTVFFDACQNTSDCTATCVMNVVRLGFVWTAFKNRGFID